jgi:ATP-binding cassette subfamily F protein uup
VLGLDGRGNAEQFADYIQWEEWRAAGGASANEKRDVAATQMARQAAPAPAPKKKLSYVEQREYDGIEARVEAADARLEAARTRVDDPAISSDAHALTEALTELESAQNQHDAIYERWAILTEKIGG